MCLVFLMATGATTPPENGNVLFSGSWTDGGYSIAGGWSIVEEDGDRFVVLDEDFKTRKAPDLKIFLSPLPLGELSDSTATEGSVLVAPLESHGGTSRYPIDAETDLGDYQSILIHCERFSKYWGGAELMREE